MEQEFQKSDIHTKSPLMYALSTYMGEAKKSCIKSMVGKLACCLHLYHPFLQNPFQHYLSTKATKYPHRLINLITKNVYTHKNRI
jgi:hypothetical protein